MVCEELTQDGRGIHSGDRLEGYTFYDDWDRSRCYFYFNISDPYHYRSFFEIDHIDDRPMLGLIADLTNNISFYRL